jgi:tetratricopeptide (TPR) repeat protein
MPQKAKPKPVAAPKEADDVDLGDLMAPSEPAPQPPAAPVSAAPAVPPPVMASGPSPQDLGDIDFCLDQGMVVDAAERLQSLEARFPGHPDVVARRHRLEGARSPSEDGRAALGDIFSDDLESVLDAELGKALTQEMAKEAPPSAAPRSEPAHVPPVDESGLFSDEQEFFNFADELQGEMKAEAPQVQGEVSLEEILGEFKKGVEQQLSSEDYETHYNLGIAYKEMQLVDEAIGEFQLAAKDPAHAVECCSMLGLCFLEKGMPQLAVKWYKKGLEAPGIRDDDRLGMLYDLGTVYTDMGERDSAYKTFLEIYGSDANFRTWARRSRLSPA